MINFKNESFNLDVIIIHTQLIAFAPLDDQILYQFSAFGAAAPLNQLTQFFALNLNPRVYKLYQILYQYLFHKLDLYIKSPERKPLNLSI